MSKVFTTTVAVITLSLGPALAANYHDYHAWSPPTVHDADSYRDYRALLCRQTIIPHTLVRCRSTNHPTAGIRPTTKQTAHSANADDRVMIAGPWLPQNV